MLAADVIEAVAQEGGQLQFKEAEHRQGEQHEQRRKAAEDPRRLQKRGEVGAEQRGHHPQGGIHQRHAHHVAAGQGKATARAGATAHHQAGEDRQHRQRARRKRQQQAQAEEHQQAPPQAALLQAAGQALILGLRGGGDGRVAAQVHGDRLRRIAQARIGAALPAELDLAGGAGGDLHFQALAIHLLLAKELVAMGFTLGQHGFFGQAVELHALLVQVVTVGNLPKQLGFAAFKTFGGKGEGFAHREEVGFCFEGVARRCLGESREQHQQKGKQMPHGQALVRCK